ncbi:MAG: 2-C-methyl-D-erythritol 4-phosphate cytidylyltransferase [Malacoplasma sp.]|nr:2-C-methyl-D-erythritol 4-phosphate cytidylyltransferase [Malacoplasma sp.]MDE7075428.1 2-C-methyl-D-erythritol 4-phosphate cytidylyltransferase [Malacoplasma sp.]
MINKKQRIFAILLASGYGTRLNHNLPKQFISVNKFPIFFYSLITFFKVKEIDTIILVVNSNFQNHVQKFINKFNFENKVKIVSGGESRHDSLINGLKSLKNDFKIEPDDLVISHDAARPLVSNEIIKNNILKLLENECEVTSTGLFSSDSVAIVECGKKIEKILDRKKVFLEQTPQAAKFSIFNEIYFNKKNINELLNKTNDFCGMALIFNKKIDIVKGNILNFKITTNQDLLLFKKILNCKN